MKLTKNQFIIWLFFGLCITIGTIWGLTEVYIETNKVYDENFIRLGGCEECGDVLVKCNNGSYEIVKNDNVEFKKICGENFLINENGISLKLDS